MLGFFNTKAWRDRLLAVAATNFTQAGVAATQSLLIDSENLVLINGEAIPKNSEKFLTLRNNFLASWMGGAVVGIGSHAYLKGNMLAIGDFAPVCIAFYNNMLALSVAPYFEGNTAHALACSTTIMGLLCTGLAACINPPRVEPVARAAAIQQPAGPTFSERFSAIQGGLTELISQSESKDSKCSNTKLKKMIRLKNNIEDFEKQHQDFLLVLMNDPVTLPESKQTYDRKSIMEHIGRRNNFCPNTRILLTASLRNLPATNVEIENTIDKGLSGFMQKLKRLGGKPKLFTANVAAQSAAAATPRPNL